jgi:glutaredoxin
MLTIYSVPKCGYCNELKEFLTKDNITFRDVNVLLPENKEEYRLIYEKTKSDEVPVIKVGKQLLIPNVSFKTIKEGFELTKKFLI